jgi:hypothetical protein
MNWQKLTYCLNQYDITKENQQNKFSTLKCETHLTNTLYDSL